MLRANQLVGFGAGLSNGPYEAFFVAHRTQTALSNSGNLDIGLEYADRMVFVGVLEYSGTGAASVSVAGKAAEKVGGAYAYGASEWWVAKVPPGSGLTNVTATFASSRASAVVVYVLKGGAGSNPSIDHAAAGGNNTNGATAYFSTAALVDDYAFAIGIKQMSNNIGGFTSNIRTPVLNASYVAFTNAGYGAGMIGPTLVARGAGVGYIGVTGADSSKPIQVSAIKIGKAA